MHARSFADQQSFVVSLQLVCVCVAEGASIYSLFLWATYTCDDAAVTVHVVKCLPLALHTPLTNVAPLSFSQNIGIHTSE